MADEETAAQTVAYSLELTPDGPSLMKRGDKVIIDGIIGTVVDVRPCADDRPDAGVVLATPAYLAAKREEADAR